MTVLPDEMRKAEERRRGLLGDVEQMIQDSNIYRKRDLPYDQDEKRLKRMCWMMMIGSHAGRLPT